jgi:hypothetical protein
LLFASLPLVGKPIFGGWNAAIRRAAAGETDLGLALLDEALRLRPRLWQAWQ